jgi:hypothetical protein
MSKRPTLTQTTLPLVDLVATTSRTWSSTIGIAAGLPAPVTIADLDATRVRRLDGRARDRLAEALSHRPAWLAGEPVARRRARVDELRIPAEARIAAQTLAEVFDLSDLCGLVDARRARDCEALPVARDASGRLVLGADAILVQRLASFLGTGDLAVAVAVFDADPWRVDLDAASEPVDACRPDVSRKGETPRSVPRSASERHEWRQPGLTVS